jgi:hypothetical protein
VDQVERASLIAAVAEAAKLIRLTQRALQRARSQCHGEVYQHIDIMCTRAYELQVRCEWLQQIALRNLEITLEAIDPQSRLGPDRRVAVDRRIAGMRKQLLGED